MNGTGVGFSVEHANVSKLPEVADEFHASETVIVVPDSRTGWATSFHELLNLLFIGKLPKWDLSRLRPAGARLKTFGGRSSGPRPLDDLFNFVSRVLQSAAGRRLTSLECHDIVCKIADIVVVGGVRRSALISLSDLQDDKMRHAKSGSWWVEDAQRALANNSAVYTEKPSSGEFMREWLALYESKSGERGIFNRYGAVKKIESIGRRGPEVMWGGNPCAEILLRPREFCNLTEVVCRNTDDTDSLHRKVELASFLGTLQSCLTDFKYVSSDFKKNCEEERLLGVSLTGIMDSELLNGAYGYSDTGTRLSALKQKAIDTNAYWAGILGINPSAALTCIKPSGTVSQLVDSSSGIHPRFSPYYIRTVRADIKDPLTKFLMDSGVLYEPDVTKPNDIIVFSFPVKSPEGSAFVKDVDAIEQLELWKTYYDFWCEHNPSITVYVKEHEWLEVGAWVYENFDSICGISFLPYSDHIYQQAPYQPISKEEYELAVSRMPRTIDWDKFGLYEKEDSTTGSQEFACVGGDTCELVDLVRS